MCWQFELWCGVFENCFAAAKFFTLRIQLRPNYRHDGCFVLRKSHKQPQQNSQLVGNYYWLYYHFRPSTFFLLDICVEFYRESCFGNYRLFFILLAHVIIFNKLLRRIYGLAGSLVRSFEQIQFDGFGATAARWEQAPALKCYAIIDSWPLHLFCHSGDSAMQWRAYKKISSGKTMCKNC